MAIPSARAGNGQRGRPQLRELLMTILNEAVCIPTARASTSGPFDAVTITESDELVALRGPWNELSGGVPFRRWEWAEAWWRHFAPTAGHEDPARTGRAELFVIAVQNSLGQIVGLAPWFREIGDRGRATVRFLGEGVACTEYLTLLCRRGLESEVADVVADHLFFAQRGAWDLIELTGLEPDDSSLSELALALERRGALVHWRPGFHRWRIDLPRTWDEYLATLSKPHRKQVRRAQRRMFESGRVQRHVAVDADSLGDGWSVLTRLHGRRRASLGQASIFDSPPFAAFHGELAERLLAAGQLHLEWLTLDGRPIAAEHGFADELAIYSYQTGIEPDVLDEGPGHLATIAVLRAAIAEGFHAVDLLRGDEPYKAHWGATPRPTCELRIVADKAAARWRHRLWLSRENLKHWLKRRLRGASSKKHNEAR